MVTILVMEVRQTLWSVFQFPSCWQVMEKPVHKSHTFSKFWGTAVCKKGSKTFMLMQKAAAFCQGRLQGAAGMLCASITLYFILNSWKMKQSLDNKEHSLQTAIKESSQVDETNVDAQDFSKQ